MKLFLLFLVFVCNVSFSLKGFIIDGEVRKKDYELDRFILIEQKEVSLSSREEIKTFNNSSIFFYDSETYLLLKEFSLIKLDLNDVFLEYGAIWLENNSDFIKKIKTPFFEFYFGKGSFFVRLDENGEFEVFSIQGNARLVFNNYNYTFSNYQRLIYKENNTFYGFIPIGEIDLYKNEYIKYMSFKGYFEGARKEKEKKWKFYIGASVSLLSGEEKNYIILAPKPGFSYKNLYVRLILPVYVDYKNDKFYKTENFGNKDEWNFESFSDSLSDLILKVDLINYKDDTVFIEAGNIEKIELGNNLIINSFKPNLNYPQKRQLSLMNNFSFYSYGIKTFISDISSGEIFGFRGYYRPFKGNKVFDKTEIGFTLVSDLDPQDIPKKKGKKKIYALGLDLNIPIYNLWEKFTINFYVENSKMFLNTDNVPDFAVSYGVRGNLFYYFSYKLGGLVLKDDYIDSYFDSIYLLERRDRLSKLIYKTDDNKYGIFFGIGFDKLSILKFEVSYRETLEEDILSFANNKFSLEFFIYPELLDFMYFNIGYYRVGINSFSEFFSRLFSDKKTSASIGVILPFKLEYLAWKLNYRRSLYIYEDSYKIENSYESQISYKF